MSGGSAQHSSAPVRTRQKKSENAPAHHHFSLLLRLSAKLGIIMRLFEVRRALPLHLMGALRRRDSYKIHTEERE